jgi:hypothetical protein
MMTVDWDQPDFRAMRVAMDAETDPAYLRDHGQDSWVAFLAVVGALPPGGVAACSPEQRRELGIDL